MLKPVANTFYTSFLFYFFKSSQNLFSTRWAHRAHTVAVINIQFLVFIAESFANISYFFFYLIRRG